MNEFNSQVCTSIEQSKRLLKLGLKPETADMHISNISTKGISYTDNWQIGSTSYKEVMHFWNEKGLKFGETAWEIIPAWSLHRLIEIYVCQFGPCLVNLKNLTFNWMVDEMETRFNYIKSLW